MFRLICLVLMISSPLRAEYAKEIDGICARLTAANGTANESHTINPDSASEHGVAQASDVKPEISQSEYARGVPYPHFPWNPLTYDPPTTSTVSALPPIISSGVIEYTGTSGGRVEFACTPESPCVLRGQRQILSSGLQISGSHFVVEDMRLVGKAGIGVVNANFGVIREIEAFGDNTGTSNGTAFGLANASYIVYYKNIARNRGVADGKSEIDYIGFVPRHNANNIWYLDNDSYEMGGDSLRTGTNVARIRGNSPPKNIYIARNRFGNNGENPIDLKFSTDIVLSSNELSGAISSVSSSGEAVVLHESADRVTFFDNHIFNVARGIVTATAGGGAHYVLIDGNTFENISQYGVYNRGGGRAEVTNNVFRNVASPIRNNRKNGSRISDSGNVVH